MAFPKLLRMQLGLSLAEFAGLLDTNVGQLSMAESGLRSLPPVSLAFAAEVQKALTAAKADKPANKPPDAKMTAWLHKHIRKCKVRMELMEITVLKLSDKMEAAERMLALSAAFTVVPVTTDVDDLHLQIAILQRTAAKKTQEYREKLIGLQLSIAGLQGEITRATELTVYQHN